MTSRTVTVPGINCGHCVAAIRRELGGLPGVSTVTADAGTKLVRVDWDETRTDWSRIRALLAEIEFPPAED